MNKLDMIKAFAKLECVGLVEKFGKFYDVSGHTMIEYNPIGGLALNCAARDKYHVEIDYDERVVYIFMPTKWFAVDYLHDSEIPESIIDCILKSKGLWNE